MPSVTIQPLQWEQIPHISDVEPFSEEDEQCFREVREVLQKYGALNRFGLTLIHTHFDVAADEILLETTDVEARTHLVRPVKQNEVDEQEVTITNWRFAEGETVAMRTCVCATASGGHLGYHRNA
jgi:hypothetical protein